MTHFIFVLRAHNKILAQIQAESNASRSGLPAIIAARLYSLVGEVDVHEITLNIIALLKHSSSSAVLLPLTRGHDTTSNWPFIDFCYVLDFDTNCQIDRRKLCGEWSTMSILQFYSSFNNEVDTTHYKNPTFKYNDKIGQGELLIALNIAGEPFFVIVVDFFTQSLEDFILKVKLIPSHGADPEFGATAIGSPCLAAQMLSKINETSASAKLVPLGAVWHSDMPKHTICFYKTDNSIAVHDEGKRNTYVHGIHSSHKNGSSLKKARYDPPVPSVVTNFAKIDDDDEAYLWEKTISVNRKVAFTETYVVKDSLSIRKGDQAVLLFKTLHGSNMLEFKDPSKSAYRGTVLSSSLKFVYSE